VASSSSRRAWFPNYQSQSGEASYQSGGIPTFNDSIAGGEAADGNEAQNQWETRLGLRVDLWAAFAYLFGPISGEVVS